MKEIHVELGQRSYTIHIERGLLDHLGERIREELQGRKVFILTDSHVQGLYGPTVLRQLEEAGLDAALLALPPGEASKTFQKLPEIFGAMLDHQMTRKDTLIALGGGVIGDLGGFAAATYLRGIPFIQVPTTLLSQVDSSVGGKVGVDLPQGKNLVGSFYQPKAVFIDPDFLHSLPDRQLRNGLAEVIKYGCIMDEDLFQQLEALVTPQALLEHMEDLVARCCQLKKTVVEADEWDRGERMKLNFGHTLGHAIETLQQYEGYLHGEAVAIGMSRITALSQARGLTREGTAQRLDKLLKQHQLPVEDKSLPLQGLLEAMGKDKKHQGEDLTVVLLEQIGTSYLHATGIGFFKEDQA